jgi:hypothetical protein
VPELRGTVLGQIGEQKLQHAIEFDFAGATSHARALDADTKGPLRDIHRRVGAAVFFESSGGQSDKVAFLPDVRFAIGEPGIDTTSIDNAVVALQRRGYYLRKAGTDGYRFFSTPTLNKVVADRKATLDPDDVRKVVERVVSEEFEKRKQLAVEYFHGDGADIPDTTRLTAVVLGSGYEWSEPGTIRADIAGWTSSKGKSPRLYPGALLWVVKKAGRDLFDKVEAWLAWQRVERDVRDGSLGDIDKADRNEVAGEVKGAEEDARDEVWASYRFVVFKDGSQPHGLQIIDLGAGHASSSESLTGRIITALRTSSLLNESPGSAYLERRWPPAFKDVAAWPVSSLRQAFLSGGMERLLDVDAYLKSKIPDFVRRGDFGFASGAQPDGTYQRVWLNEELSPDEVTFDAGVFLLTKARAKALTRTVSPAAESKALEPLVIVDAPTSPRPPSDATIEIVTIRVSGDVPPESWTKLGIKLIPKLKSGKTLTLRLDASVDADGPQAETIRRELRQVFMDLGLADRFQID